MLIAMFVISTVKSFVLNAGLGLLIEWDNASRVVLMEHKTNREYACQ